jgi:integrase
MELTAKIIAKLTLPAGKTDHIFWDNNCPGLGLRLRGPNRTWVIQYRFGKRQRRISLDAGNFTLEAARKVARNYLAQVQLGQDPAVERDKLRETAAPITLTLGDIAKRYIDSKQDVLRPSSFNSIKRHLTVHFARLAAMPLVRITRQEIALQLHIITKDYGRTAAARARSTLSSLFAWAMREGLCEANPVILSNDPLRGIDNSRDRVLADNELAAIWNACRDDDFSRIIRLLILTGCRRDEIGSLRWSEIDFDAGTITIAAARSKNRRTHCLILPGPALDILQAAPRRPARDYVFGQSGQGFQRWGAYTAALRERLGNMPPWTLHDLRRTFRTGLGRLGIPSHIAELAINHTRSGIEAVYDRHSYAREIGHALALWADHVTAIIDGRPASNVTPLRRESR